MKKNRDNLYWMIWIVFGLYLLYRVALVFYPQPDAGGVEGNIVYFIQRLLDGQSLYTDPEFPPYAIAQYAPLYYYIVAGTAKALGIQPDNVMGVFMTSRIVSLLLNLLFIRIVYEMARKAFEISPEKSFCVSVLAFIFLEITSFSRPDSLHHVLFMGSILLFLLFVKAEGKPGATRLLILFAICAVTALFSKQTAFLLPLIAGAWFLWRKQFRSFFTLAICYVLFLLAALAMIYFLGNFQLFYKNTITGISNGISLGWFNSVIMPSFYYSFGLVFLLVALVLGNIMKKETSPLLQASGYLVISLFICCNAVAIKNGSNAGYFTEWWTILFVLVAFYWPVFKQRTEAVSNSLPGWLVGAVLIVKTLLLLGPMYGMTVEAPLSKRRAEFEGQKAVATRLISQQQPGEQYFVFTNFNTAESYFSNLLFRHAVMPQMDIIALSTYPQKKFDYKDFIQRLQGGEFRWMIMKETGPQKRFFEILLERYVLKERTQGYNIYEFQSSPG